MTAPAFCIKDRKRFKRQYSFQLWAAVILALASTVFFSKTAYCAQITISWNQSTDPLVTGYKVYYGNASRNYSWVIDAGPALTCTITGLSASQVYCVAITAYTPTTESGFSQELVCYFIAPATPVNGQITPSDTVALSSGSSKTFSIVSDTGYQVSDVLIDNLSVGAVTQYTFSNLNACHTIAANFTALTTNYTITASASGSGTISPLGTVSVPSGTDQAFTITPAANYQIKDVQVDSTSVGQVSSYAFAKVTANHTIAATFAPIATYTISATAQGSGTISPSGTVSVPSGTDQTFTITPAAGYQVKDVQADSTSIGQVSSYTFAKVTANHTIAATFAPIAAYTISATAQGSGTISPLGTVSVPSGTDQTFTITPAAGYQVKDVEADNTSIGQVSSYTFAKVTANHTISATFAHAASFSISATVQGSGSISPSGKVNVVSGNDKTFTVTPASRHRVEDVRVDGTSIGSVSSYTFSDVAANHSITAVVSKIPPPIADAGPDQIVGPGTIVTLNGSNSTDSIAGIASYKWTQVSGPQIALSSPSEGICTFTAPDVASAKSLSFKLVVTNNGGVTQSDSCFVNVSATDQAPLADAGPDQAVHSSGIVTLNGSGSSDPDGAIASYKWVQVKGPAASMFTANNSHAMLLAPDPGPCGASLVFQLQVADRLGLKTTDQCIVNVTSAHSPPDANAGPNQAAATMSSVTLNGSGSYDPGGSTLTYRWKQIRGAPVTLSDPTAAAPVFAAPSQPGADGVGLLFRLTVTNTDGLSASGKCTVNVGP